MESYNILKVLAQIAGIGGVSLGILFLLFRNIITRTLTKTLPSEKAFSLVRLIIILTFSISIVGLLGYFMITLKSMDNEMGTMKLQLDEATRSIQSYKDSLSNVLNITEKTRYSNIQEYENHTLLDLTGWKKLTDEEKKGKIKKSIGEWRITSRLAKVTEDVKYYFEDAATSSGIPPLLSCQTHKFNFYENKDENRIGGENMKRYLIDIDISNEPPQREFEIRYTQIYYNSFQGETQDWGAVPINNPMQKMTFEIIFPPNKPFKSYTLLAYPDLPSQPREVYEGNPIISADPNGKSLKWTVENPKLRYIYRINWQW